MYLADGSLDMKLVLVKINVSPFQPQQLPQPHTGAEVKDEHIAHLCKVHIPPASLRAQSILPALTIPHITSELKGRK